MLSAQKKKILYIITTSNWGGAQRYVYDLATHLPREQFVAGVALGQGGLLAPRLKEAGVAIYPIALLQRDVAATADIKSFFELLQLFHKERPDVVHLNSSKAAGLGALAARLAGVPRIIFTVHGWPFWEQRGPLARGLIYFFSWVTALLADNIIVVCDYDRKVARKMPFIGHKTARIYNGIDIHFPLGSGDIIRRSFPSGIRITGTIGELNKNKNQIALIEQAKRDSTLHVAIVGDGENRSYLMKKIQGYGLESRVKLFGFHPASEVLRGFDVFALPSLKEGLPYVLLEAKAAGLPIVASRVGGVGEVLDAKDMTEFALARMVEKTVALYR